MLAPRVAIELYAKAPRVPSPISVATSSPPATPPPRAKQPEHPHCRTLHPCSTPSSPLLEQPPFAASSSSVNIDFILGDFEIDLKKRSLSLPSSSSLSLSSPPSSTCQKKRRRVAVAPITEVHTTVLEYLQYGNFALSEADAEDARSEANLTHAVYTLGL